MDSFLDIAPSHRLVPLGDKKVPVYGITLEDLAWLFSQYPEEVAKFFGTDKGKASEAFTAESLIKLLPDAINSVLIIGLGYRGTENEEAARARAAKLTVGEQVLLLEAIIEQSMADGLNPTTERLANLAAKLDGGKGAARSSPLRKPSKS